MGHVIEIPDEPRRGDTFILDRCLGYATLWLSLVGCDSTHGLRRGLQTFRRAPRLTVLSRPVLIHHIWSIIH